MPDSFYTSRDWRDLSARAVARDGRCIPAWLLGLGGDCHGRLDAHHVIPRAERPDLELDLSNVLTVCARHHPMVEALRRAIVERRERDRQYRCPHRHVTPEGRRQCEERRRRELVAA